MLRPNPGMDVQHVDPADRARAEACARLMLASEPWITLGRALDSALAALQDPGKELNVVLEDDEVAAFVLLEMRGPLAGYIQTICVRPDRRGRGLGAALIGWAERRIARESPNVFLCVSSFNDGARRLYERLGYQVVGRLPGFIVREHDELLLRKTRGPWAEFKKEVMKENACTTPSRTSAGCSSASSKASSARSSSSRTTS